MTIVKLCVPRDGKAKSANVQKSEIFWIHLLYQNCEKLGISIGANLGNLCSLPIRTKKQRCFERQPSKYLHLKSVCSVHYSNICNNFRFIKLIFTFPLIHFSSRLFIFRQLVCFAAKPIFKIKWISFLLM